MKKLILILASILTLGYSYGQTDFTLSNGVLSYVTSSGDTLVYSSGGATVNGNAQTLIEPSGRTILNMGSVGTWGGHSINGVTYDKFSSFAEALKSDGWTLSNVGGGSGDTIVVETYVDESRFPFYQLMDDVGDGTGNDNMAVDAETTPDTFRIVANVALKVYIARIITSIRDGGSFDSGGWGNNGGIPLTNGIELKWKRNGVVYNLTKNPIQSHYDLASYSYDISHNNWGQGDGFVSNRFTFTKAGNYIILDGSLGDELWIIINDDLSYLVDQRVSAQGYAVYN